MRAAWYEHPGAAREVLQLGTIPAPIAEPGEVLIQIRASGINPSDYKRRGAPTSNPAPLDRMVPHSDGAGIVVDVGAGVPADWIGRRVWVWNAVYRQGYAAPAARELGTAAEFLAIPLQFVSILPDVTSFEVGACLGVPAFTAYAAVLADGPVDNMTVLVQGGAGAVGELAVQFAATSGATVIATVSSDQKAQRARESGAHHVINYRTTDVPTAVKALAPSGVDRIVEVDFSANIRADSEMLTPYGVIASYSSTSNPEPVLPYYALQFKAATVRTIQVFTMPAEMRSNAINAITTALESGSLRPTIAATFTLDEIALAHEAAEGNSEGNITLSL
jgi:NADPH2:quinone reductase